MKLLSTFLADAKQLPTHDNNGNLQPHYKMFVEGVKNFNITYSENDSPANLFKLIERRPTGAQRLYTLTRMTYRENGTIKPKKEWEEILMFHKAWSRKDVEVKKCSYDVVGIKRQTTSLPAGVLIANLKFVY